MMVTPAAAAATNVRHGQSDDTGHFWSFLRDGLYMLIRSAIVQVLCLAQPYNHPKHILRSFLPVLP